MNQRDGTLTVLFTDLVGSTALSNRLGDEAGQALRRAHDRLLREQFQAFGGTIIKGVGDGFFVTFPTARQGVACACAVQRAVASQQAEGRYLELKVRVGVNTGEPLSEGGDVYGTDVDMAARLTSEAQGGEIIISEVTRLLVRQQPFKIEFAGDRVLKGFPQPVATYRVSWQEDTPARPRLSRFIGREGELAKLRGRLAALFQRQGGLVLIAGEPGIGKTRLANELAVLARDRGARVLAGRAYETEGLPPYYLFADALGQFLRSRPREDLTRLIAGDAAYITRMLPELRDVVSAAEPSGLSPEAERYLLFEAASNLLRRFAEETPLVLLLDDIHWADHASVYLLQHLAKRIADAPVLVVATYRQAELGSGHPLSALVAEINRRGPGECLTLHALSREDAAALVEDVVGKRAPEGVANALYATAEGNPFFTEELVRDLQEQGRDLADADAAVDALGLPEGVRQVIERRLVRLSDESHRVLAHSSVLGHDLSLPIVAAITGNDEALLLDLLDEALGAGLLRESAEGYAFAHPLIQEALSQELSMPRRRRLHLRAAQALERAAGPSPDSAQLIELANHFFQGADMPRAVGYARRGGDAAMAQLAYEEAARLYEMALKAFSAAGVTDAPLHCELLLALGDAQSRTGEGSSAAEAFREAASIAKEQRDGECLARAALGYGGLRRSAGFVDEPLIQLLNEALDALPDEDSALRARVLARLAVARYHAASHESIQSQSQQAVAMARRLDDKETLVYVLETAHFYLTDQLDSAARIAAAGELIPLAESIGHREIALRARRAKIIDLLGLGRVQEADAELATFARLAEEARHTTLRWDAAVCFAMRALLDGRYSEAEGLIDRALALGRDAQGQTYLAFLFYQIQLFRLRRAQGRLAELEDGTRTFVQRYGVIPARAALGILEMELDRAGAARDEFERMAAQDFADLAEDYNLPAALTQLAELCAFVGDARRAAILYERLLPWEHQVATMGATADSNGAVARYLGLLASTMERWNDAERHFRAAIALHQRMGARPFLMHTLRDYAAMLEKRNAPGDLTEAERLLKEADAIARDLDVRVAVAQ